jgi:signal transduction histidine kinase
MSWDDITYSDDLGANLEAFNQVLDGRTNEYSLDKRFIRKDGSLVFTHVASRCLRLEDGSVDYFVVLFKDISDEKAREIESALRLKELTDINLKLKNAQSQLLQSEKMAAVGQLAAGVAHEINNPVGFVSSNLHTLKNYTEQLFLMEQADAKAVQALEPLDPVRIEVERAHKEAQIEYLRQDIADLLAESSDGLSRVRKIVADLKNFSHVDDGEWQDVDLNQGLESTLHVAWNELKYKAKVVRDFGDIPFVHCIPGQINQVFLNLLINAVHAIQESGVITLRTRHDGDFVTVEVEDTGSGIPAEIKERIFEPFFTTKPVGKGTGLGLSISWEIVQRHKGTITVQSEVGHGTLFQVKLPALSTTQH